LQALFGDFMREAQQTARKKGLDTLSAGDTEPWPAGGAGDDADQDVLRHLLDVEAGAQSLVDDAQAEADRRMAEAEKRNRARYEEQYTKEAALLDSRYESGLGAIKDEYNKLLDEYRLTLDARKPDYAEFRRLLDSFLEKGR
jgi:vacuolar-type H+-ATPase subunit H